MQLSPYVEELRASLLAAAQHGENEHREIIDRLLGSLDSSARLVLLEALSAAADELTGELAPASVEVRLRGLDPEFVVTTPPAPRETEPDLAAPAAGQPGGETDDGGTTRTTLRLPEQLKQRVEEAAAREGLSVNSWLVRAVGAALGSPPGGTRPAPRGPSSGQRLTGWAH